jgi:hypothetical protein
MSEMVGGRYTRNDCTYLNAWFVYAALADTGRSVFVAKIGISSVPMQRLATLHMGSPYPVTAAMWAMVGGRGAAARAESRIKKAFADRRTRGEWFEFDHTSAEDRARFNFTVKSLCAVAAERTPEWQRITQEQIKAFIQLGCHNRWPRGIENTKKGG